MKILHISPSYYPAIKFGGPIQSVHLLNKALVKKGVMVDVLTTTAGLDSDQSAERKGRWSNLDGVRVKYLNFIGYEHYNFSIPLFFEIRKIIKNYDLVHITAVWNFPVLAGSILGLLKGRPYIIAPHGTLYKETVEIKSSNIKKIYWTLFAKYYIEKASALHYTTEDEQEKVKNYLHIKSNSFMVPNGIDLSEIDYKEDGLLNSDKKYILSLGRISKKKGFNLLIPAFSKLIREYDLNLVIAGPDNEGYKKEVERIVKKENLEERIIFTGLIDDEKWSLYKKALMFVLPSYSENFGMTVVEAMACETPVVVSDKVGIYKEVADAKAGIIVKTEVGSLYKGMKQLVENEKLRKAISENGKNLLKKNMI